MSTTMETGAENRAHTLPPGPRDWLAYRLVKVQQRTTREAAKELHVSQTRVCQLVARVVEYLEEIAPGCESPEARGRRLYIAESVAAERIDYLFGQVSESYRNSIGEQKIVRTTATDYGPPKTIEVTRHCPGDGRLAIAAARLATLGAKMPANKLLPQVPDDVLTEEVCDEEICAEENCDEDHPVEDCSRNGREPAVAATPTGADCEVTAAMERASAADPELAAMLNFLKSRPVQSPEVGEVWDAFMRAESRKSPFLQMVLADG